MPTRSEGLSALGLIGGEADVSVPADVDPIRASPVCYQADQPANMMAEKRKVRESEREFGNARA